MSEEPLDYGAVRRVPIAAVLARLGLLETLRRTGHRLTGPCPVHRGSNRKAFSVDERKNLWICFGDCRRGGSPIELVAALERVTPRDAARLIAKWFALGPRLRTSPQPGRRTTVSNATPSHKVFVVEQKDGDEEGKGFWHRVGSAWVHKDQKGFNVVLSSLPLDGRLVLREFDPEEERKEEEQRGKKRK